MNAPAQARSPIDDIRATLNQMGPQFEAVMPSKDHVQRFIRVVVTAVQQNAGILDADRTSFYAACMKCAQDGLLPDGKEAFLNTYKTNLGDKETPKWAKIVEYQPMVGGMIKKLRNSGEIVGAPKVHVIREGDEFTYELGDNERIVHKPKIGVARGKVLAAYSIVKLKSGDTSREVIGIEEIMQARERSRAKDSGPWKLGEGGAHSGDFAEMCRKTVFRRHSKMLPKNTDLDNVLKSDDETFHPLPTGAQAVAEEPAQVAALPAPSKRPAALETVASQGAPAPKVEAREPVTVEQKPNPQDII